MFYRVVLKCINNINLTVAPCVLLGLPFAEDPSKQDLDYVIASWAEDDVFHKVTFTTAVNLFHPRPAHGMYCH